jgi:hypothetical protein
MVSLKTDLRGDISTEGMLNAGPIWVIDLHELEVTDFGVWSGAT